MDEKRYNSNGEELFFDNGIWVPKRYILTEEQKAKYYQRFTHPHIHWVRAVILLFLSLISIVIPSYAIIQSALPLYIKILAPICLVFLLIGIHLKPLAIFAIKLYQYFAPMKIRERCVFTPTCSDYMIAAIQKYGLLKGVRKGIARLKRCHGEHREDPLD